MFHSSTMDFCSKMAQAILQDEDITEVTIFKYRTNLLDVLPFNLNFSQGQPWGVGIHFHRYQIGVMIDATVKNEDVGVYQRLTQGTFDVLIHALPESQFNEKKTTGTWKKFASGSC